MQPFPLRFAQPAPAPELPRTRTRVPSLKGRSSLAGSAAAGNAGDGQPVPRDATAPEFTHFGKVTDFGDPDGDDDCG